jgi:L-malate glycosyltransferase
VARPERILEVKPKILLMVQQLTQGGSERQCAAAAVGLKARGYEVHAAAMREGGIRAKELAVAGIPLPVFPVHSFASADPVSSGLALRRYLKRHGIGVVHTFDAPSNAFAIPWARLAGIERVFSSQRAHRELTPSALRPLETLSHRMAHGIVTNCLSVRRELIAAAKLPAAKIHLAYNGIDTRLFHPEGPRASLPFPSDAAIVGTLCALRPEKDLATLQAAFARIAPEFPQAHLVFVGDGPERARLEANSLPGRTYFAGTQKETAPWYRAIRIFVLPSRSEALSNSLLEALACGCSALASEVGGNPEITDRLFAPGDVSGLAQMLRRELNDGPGMATSLPAQFTLERFLDSLLELYLAGPAP